MNPERRRVVAESRALQVVLCALQADEAGAVDAINRAVDPWEVCPHCSLDVVLALVNLVTVPINSSGHRDHLITHVEATLQMLLDELVSLNELDGP